MYWRKIRNVLFLSVVACFWLTAVGAQDAGTLAEIDEKYPKTKVKGLNVEEKVTYAPSISADGKTMVIESDKDGRWMLYISSKISDNEWGELEAIDPINNYGDTLDLIAGPNFSYDGNTLFFHASFDGGFGSEDIYYAERRGETWSEPINIGPQINSSGHEGFPSISADGRTLYFVRIANSQPDAVSQICYTIYRSTKDADGNWTEPVPLPYPVNQGCEKSPRIMADNKTLIFASIREDGREDFDLYQSQRGEDGDWSTPIPLHYVNTPGNDLFACISASGELMYFNVRNGIYSVVIPEDLRQFKNIIIQGYVLDADTRMGLPANLIVTDANTSERFTAFTNNPSDGRYAVVLTVGREYNLDVESTGYSNYLTSYDLRELTAYNEYEQDIELFTAANLYVNIFDVELYETLPATTIVKDMQTGAVMARLQNDLSEGRTKISLPLGRKYAFEVECENFSKANFDLDLTGLVVYRDFEKDIELIPNKVGVQINVTDLMSDGKIGSSQVVIRNKTRNETIVVNGNQAVSLRVGDRYLIEASSDRGYAFNSTEVAVSESGLVAAEADEAFGGVNEAPKIGSGELSLQLQPLKKDAELTLKEINFETNSAQLSDVSFQELNRVIKLMKDYPSLKVEISAHTDDIGSDRYNQILSEKRAQSVVDYLIENEIENDRFVAKGYGESKPMVANDSDENRARNRRVELKILDIESTKE